MQYVGTELKKELIISNVVSIHYHEYTPDFSYSGESHPFWELIYCDKGTLCITAGQKKLTLSQTEAFIHTPGQYHNVTPLNKCSASSIVISFSSDSKCVYDIADQVISCDEYTAESLASILREARECFENRLETVFDAQLVRKSSTPFAAEQTLQCYIELLMIYLLRKKKMSIPFTALKRNQKSEQTVNRVCKYMSENLSQKLTFEGICEEFHVSPTALKRCFKTAYGHGAMEHLSILRTERSKELLREGNHSCTEIASMCGFFSVHHFCRVFKERYGIPPTAYVKTVRARFEMPDDNFKAEPQN